MPIVNVVYYTEDGIKAPVLNWIHRLNEKVKIKCMRAIKLLASNGHDLRRPQADSLDRDIRELRIVYNNNQYRILYFFYRRKAVVLTSGFLKKGNRVPVKEIDRAVECKVKYKKSPKLHTYKEESE